MSNDALRMAKAARDADHEGAINEYGRKPDRTEGSWLQWDVISGEGKWFTVSYGRGKWHSGGWMADTLGELSQSLRGASLDRIDRDKRIVKWSKHHG